MLFLLYLSLAVLKGCNPNASMTYSETTELCPELQTRYGTVRAEHTRVVKNGISSKYLSIRVTCEDKRGLMMKIESETCPSGPLERALDAFIETLCIPTPTP